ncbi:DUF6422 family protein [Kitasatospora sp. A2-31]|uniref:DUF6422 family protein n=1 Tax=Kitasatospora sp. A2-31 TaxID=2916414 RepID=UPI001EEAA91D|nr:DUF6422 family protein [Kitasatospora sp. A2-31]MCG6494134.1 hypothetical protein [Kitasatospora sp. A2-31]MCG6500256.1 hypothetical protein [Kitasatospora sp. A2-31]
MPDIPHQNVLNAEQAQAWEEAAYLIITARKEAAAILARSKVEPVPEEGWFGNPCTAKLPFPPYPPCGCHDYRGDGGPCTTPIRVPDTGEGSLHPLVPCSHARSQHIET